MAKTQPTDHYARDAGHRAEPATLTVLTRVRELIVTGKIAAGTRLAAETIAKEQGISRTPVRSALAVLTAEGLASYHINRGYTVREINLRDILDAIETRAVLEAKGCGLSVDYGWTLPEFDRLCTAIDEGAALIAGGKWSEEIERGWYQSNRDFHSLIVRVSRNNALRNAIRMTLVYPVFGDIARLCPAVARYVPQRHRNIPDVPPEHVIASQSDHEEILEAIRSEEAERAEQLMLAHVLKSKDRLAAIATRR
ncbi:GntR family transcriptional regulator [Parasphingorhabdus sp.]|uniref:GntR family transcriptional regulator n=1 Tax=Parasphingorhabdus sp. TaxID=2709688 RepID=UPI002B26CB50|nr:GntR family transcriptional regulator [Parasphingorhabdus sp.]